MKIDVWVLSTCVPEDRRPCIPEVFATEAEGRAAFREAMRQEWSYNGPVREQDGATLPFPEDKEPEEINDILCKETAAREWASWELTKHSVEINPTKSPIAMMILLDCFDRGYFQPHQDDSPMERDLKAAAIEIINLHRNGA